MSFENGAILDDLGARFKVKSGDDMSASEKLSREIYVCGSDCHHRCHICFLPVKKNYPMRF